MHVQFDDFISPSHLRHMSECLHLSSQPQDSRKMSYSTPSTTTQSPYTTSGSPHRSTSSLLFCQKCTYAMCGRRLKNPPKLTSSLFSVTGDGPDDCSLLYISESNYEYSSLQKAFNLLRAHFRSTSCGSACSTS